VDIYIERERERKEVGEKTEAESPDHKTELVKKF